MEAKDLIELNNEKRKLLTTENENTYSDMLIYIRLAKVPEYHAEELLIEILDHLIEGRQEEKMLMICSAMTYRHTAMN